MSSPLAIGIIVIGLAVTPLYAQDPPREVKSEFRQHVVRRDRLIRELNALDSKAADAVADGKKPNATHAEQIELQDEIDLIQLRIETMAMRWNLDIPDPPKPGEAAPDAGTATTAKVEAAFQEGRNRAERHLQARCRQMLASIDYDTFLSRGE
jgi:hypothetical protein